MRIIKAFSVIVVLLMTLSSAYAGPCTAELAQIEQQIGPDNAGASAGPSAPQSVAAQLGQQPTPATVQGAERKANALAQTTLQRVRQADDDNNAAACNQAFSHLKDLYGIQ